MDSPAPPRPDNVNTPIEIHTHEFAPTRGGIAIYVEELANALHEMKRAPVVHAPRNAHTQFPFAVLPKKNNGTHGLLDLWRTFCDFFSARSHLDKKMLILAEPAPILSFACFHFLFGKLPERLVLIFHGSEILRFHKNPLSRFFVQRLLSHADKIVVLSHHNARLLTERFPPAADRLSIIPGAPRSFANTPAPARALPDAGKHILLMVGRFHPRKGQDTLLEIAEQLPVNIRANLAIWMVGQPIKQAFFKSLQEQAGKLDCAVRFFTDVPDEELPHFYKRASLFVMTSRPWKNSVEGFGLVYLEASAHGLPIVGFDVGGVRDAVREDETGFLFPEGDLVSARDKIAELLENETLREKLSARAVAHAASHSWQGIAQQIIS